MRYLLSMLLIIVTYLIITTGPFALENEARRGRQRKRWNDFITVRFLECMDEMIEYSVASSIGRFVVIDRMTICESARKSVDGCRKAVDTAGVWGSRHPRC